MILPERVFGRSAAKRISIRPRDRADLLDDVLLELVGERGRRLDAFFDGDERRNRLAFDLVRTSDDRGFGDLRVIDERALDFHRAEPMPGDVQHVVDAAEQPEEAVLVAPRAVAGEVRAVRPAAPGTCWTKRSGSP